MRSGSAAACNSRLASRGKRRRHRAQAHARVDLRRPHALLDRIGDAVVIAVDELAVPAAK